ncbi:DASH family cryptochrome [Gracilimonas mengyeensis]|uniref:Cryptochrome DASH n=1 Tax=Gracilimonas mengyeensis TaxID=1302730 RepID=A0A521FA56_9BACT|nr:DASH family cryptochrome [Gracilimonas mengyeensis]SMO93036.1 deoxyribodipyrimidine photo-lyase (single-stranded DNA-specific) [Gracilimonas mengyeensis]
MTRAIIWFRNNLRIHDNESLIKACQADEMIPLYCVDPRHFGNTSFGFPKTGSLRAQFLIESLEDLKSSLQDIGCDLVVRRDKPEEVIPDLVEKYDVDVVFIPKEITREEIDIEEKLKSRLGDKLSFTWESTLFHINDIPYSKNEIPDVFTNYRKKTEKEAKVRKEYEQPTKAKLVDGIEVGDIPSLKELGLSEKEQDDRAVLDFKGGEKAALERLQEYFWEGDHLKNYKFTRNGLLGADYSSKFSPWLANGSLSPRRIYWEVNKYEEQRKKNVSTYWMIFELIWRDYFRFSAWKHGDKIFWPSGIQAKQRDWSHDKDRFKKWAEGNTGIPFIDANMRELNATGYMSNRGRQNVASFLAQNLNIDWRMGAEYFESLLLDYDPCSNYGNWAYNATVGHDPRNRYFNIVNQAQKYDSDGDYVRTWVSELEGVPDEFIHEPHKMTPEQQTLFDVKIGDEYPKPMINLDESYEEIKTRD